MDKVEKQRESEERKKNLTTSTQPQEPFER
jgi:hypothetical protein